jgi:hypothetical protein
MSRNLHHLEHTMANIQFTRLPIIALLAFGGISCGVNPDPSSPAITMLNMTVTLDEVAPGQPSKVGDVDKLRIVYDAAAIDPKTRRVKLLNMQHFTGGRYSPPTPDPAIMPMDDSWLDVSSVPYRLHYRASVVHGQPIIIDVDENSRRLTIHPQAHPEATLISGPYSIDPIAIVGPDAFAAGSPARLAPAAAPAIDPQRR